MKATLSQQQLEMLIDRYFDAVTTEAEEYELRCALAAGQYSLTPKVRQALAVMSLTAVRRSRRSAGRRHSSRFAYYAAAALTGAALLAATWAYKPKADSRSPLVADECQAYIAGRATSDPKVVMNMMANDLALMAEASDAFAQEISCNVEEFSDMPNEISQL